MTMATTKRDPYLRGYKTVERREMAMLQAAMRRDITFFANDPTPDEIAEYDQTVKQLEDARKKGQTVDVGYDL